MIKRTEKKQVVEITRRMVHGLLSQAEQLRFRSRGGTVLNTAITLRLNGTFRERLVTLTRKSRHAARGLRALETGMDLIACTYNFCFAHHELSNASHLASASTPAIAAGRCDSLWSVDELLSYKPAPPLGLNLAHHYAHTNDLSLIPCRLGGPEFFSERGSYAPSPDSGVLPLS